MLAATKEKMSGSVKKVNKNMYGISSIECATRKFNFRTFYVVVVQNNGKEMFIQSVLHVQSFVLLIRRYVVFFLPFSLPSLLSITRFYIKFEQTINIIERLAFSPG